MPTQTAYDVFDAVRARPWECLHEQSVEHLSTFWSACRWTLRQRGLAISPGRPDFEHFGMWVAARRGDGLHTGGWQHFLPLEATGEAGLGLFFRELDEFRGLRITSLARAQLRTALPWPRYVTQTVGEAASEAPNLAAVTDLELRAYLPTETYFLVAIRSDGVETERWCWTRARAMTLAENELSVRAADWVELMKSQK